jgi:hypothetical protein
MLCIRHGLTLCLLADMTRLKNMQHPGHSRLIVFKFPVTVTTNVMTTIPNRPPYTFIKRCGLGHVRTPCLKVARNIPRHAQPYIEVGYMRCTASKE